MVKTSRNERVWEAPKPKQRKKRTKRTKQEIQNKEQQLYSVLEQKKVEINNNISLVQEKIAEELKQSSEQKEENLEKFKKQANQNEIKQRIILKDILLSDLEFDQGCDNNESFSLCHRQEQRSTILAFLSQRQRKQPDWLYIYGPPGIGKTYLIKNLLKRQQLIQKAIWLNCYSILQKTKLQYSKFKKKAQKDIKIVVIDEFDQLQTLMLTKKFKYKFMEFILQLNSQVLIEDVGKIKYILISNKSYHSLLTEALENIKQIMKCQRIIQRPFMPYNLKSLHAIIKNKIQRIELVMNHMKFNMKLVQIAVNKIYNTSQDIRVVLAFIIDNYQSLLVTEESCNLSQKKLKFNFIDEITFRKNEMKQEQNIVCKYLKRLNDSQKHLIRQIILQYEEANNKNSPYKIECVYKQGQKKNIDKKTLDVWLQQWSQMEIVSKKRVFPKGQHYLFPAYTVSTSLTMKQFKPYLY